MEFITARIESDYLKKITIELYNINMMEHLQTFCRLCNNTIVTVLDAIKKNDDHFYDNLMIYLHLLENSQWTAEYQKKIDLVTSSIVLNTPCNHFVTRECSMCELCKCNVDKSINLFTLNVYTSGSYINYMFKIVDDFIKHLTN